MVVDCHIEVGYCHTGGMPMSVHMFCLSSRRACARIAGGGAAAFRTDPMWFTDYMRREGVEWARARDRGGVRRAWPARSRPRSLKLPATTDDLRKLEIGTVVYLTGRVFTAREGVYKRAIEDGVGMPASRDALGLVNFHCSPAAAVNADGTYNVGAVTATASFRFAKWLEGWFKLSGCNIIIGKGGMTSEIYRTPLRAEPGDLSHHRRLRHRRPARPRHQARRRRLLARGARPRPGGVGARRREFRAVPGRERP